MTGSQTPVPYNPQRPTNGTSVSDMVRMVASTTDVRALVSTVAEAYRLTVSLERDIVEIKAYYENLERQNAQFHREMMLALEGRFSERAAQIVLVRETATQLIAEKQFDLAHSIINQLMKLLQQSPVEEVMSNRRR